MAAAWRSQRLQLHELHDATNCVAITLYWFRPPSSWNFRLWVTLHERKLVSTLALAQL